MGSRRSYNERLEDLKRRREELRQQEKALMARQIAQERKDRTRRWLSIGREIEAAVGHDIEGDDMELILESVRELFAQCPQRSNRNDDYQSSNENNSQNINSDSAWQNDQNRDANSYDNSNANSNTNSYGNSNDNTYGGISTIGEDNLDDMDSQAMCDLDNDSAQNDIWEYSAAPRDHSRFSH